ncbi:TPM domain-containing protein [Actinoplanes aureus]|uniref:TPM domain-containing protein n=1 Tax=Actinoplanes aureus TaxID=2792083 RepID=A0A931CD92_9ACTN|nr:TPM domain-containing protein [Actinoplanes aureus]MBG0565832.1 TPM domain-containing protein [Actinoplanes aureus]
MIARALAAASAATAASLLAIALPAPASAAPAYPAADGRCVDRTGVLGDDLCSQITAILRADEKATSDEIAVAVVPTTGDASIEAWSTGLFNHWGVGKADRDNGVLLVVAVDDHRVRLATGDGMAERLDDTAAADIVDTVITPRFAADEYALGVLDGLDEVRRRIGHDVPAGTALAGLAPVTSDPGADPDAGPIGIPDDGGFVTGPDGEISTFAEEEPAGGSSAGAFVLLGLLFGGLAVIGFVLSRLGSSASERRYGHHPAPARPHTMPHHHSPHSSMTNNSSSSSDFGGGSSSGGGSSGSW